MQYLKKRTANFSEGEKAVTLLIDERLFLLFDFTHDLKNISNNFVTRKRYRVPEIANANAQHILGGKCLAQFEHINRL